MNEDALMQGSAVLEGSASAFLTVYAGTSATFQTYATVQNSISSAKISAEAQSLTPDNLISLYEIDLTHIGLGIVRFTPNVAGKTSAISWGGNTYYPWPIEIEGIEKKTEGSAARPSLRAAAILPEMSALLIGAHLQGAKVSRIRTFRRFLDDGEEPSTTDHFPIDCYRIERVSEWISGQSVTLELANPLDIEDAYFPKRQIIRDYCYWRYRTYDPSKQEFVYNKISACPYAGTRYFNQKNEEVSEPSLDSCSKTLKGCKLRFGEYVVLPFGGFPGTAPKAR